MKKAKGYNYSTPKDIFEWETKKMKFKNHLTYYKPTEKSKTIQSVQCSANSIDPFPVSHYRQCENKTRNSNGLCYIHQLIDKNVTIKYWKN